MRWVIGALALAALSAGAVILAYSQACGCAKPSKDQPQLLAMADNAVFLPGTAWTVAELRGKPPVGATPLTLQFDDSGAKAFGHAGCNRFFGTAAVNGPALTVTGIGSTKMYCHAEGVMAQEGVYLGTLGAVKTMTLQDGFLLLKAADGETLLKLAKNIGPA